MATFTRGETVRLEATIRTLDGALSNPDTSITVRVEDSAGAVKVDSVAATNDRTGYYYYLYTLLAAAATGVWYFEFKATDDTVVTIEGGSFTVAASTTEA